MFKYVLYVASSEKRRRISNQKAKLLSVASN